MQRDPIKVAFENKQQPSAGFDLIRLESLFDKNDLDHSPFDFHLVRFFLIIVIEQGHGVHTIDFVDYDYSPGTVLTVRQDQIHKFNQSDHVTGRLLLFTEDFMVAYLEELEALKTLQLFNEIVSGPKIVFEPAEFVQLLAGIDRIEQEYFEKSDDYSLGIIRSELHILITKLYRRKSTIGPKSENRKYLQAFIDFQNLIEQYSDTYKKVEEYAREMGVSAKTLNNITRSIINKSAKEFVDELRTKNIKRLLINTEDSISEIAYTVGFDEPTNFYKYFKRQTGKTPEKFRLAFRS